MGGTKTKVSWTEEAGVHFDKDIIVDCGTSKWCVYGLKDGVWTKGNGGEYDKKSLDEIDNKDDLPDTLMTKLKIDIEAKIKELNPNKTIADAKVISTWTTVVANDRGFLAHFKEHITQEFENIPSKNEGEWTAQTMVRHLADYDFMKDFENVLFLNTGSGKSHGNKFSISKAKDTNGSTSEKGGIIERTKAYFYNEKGIDKTKVAIGALLGTAAVVGGGVAANELMTDKRSFMQKHGGKVAAGVVGTAAAAAGGYYAYKNGMLPIKPDDHETTSGESTLDTSSGKRTGSSSKRSSGSSGSGDAPKKSNKGLLIGVVVIVLGVIAFFVLSGGDEEESEAPMGDDLV